MFFYSPMNLLLPNTTTSVTAEQDPFQQQRLCWAIQCHVLHLRGVNTNCNQQLAHLVGLVSTDSDSAGEAMWTSERIVLWMKLLEQDIFHNPIPTACILDFPSAVSCFCFGIWNAVLSLYLSASTVYCASIKWRGLYYGEMQMCPVPCYCFWTRLHTDTLNLLWNGQTWESRHANRVQLISCASSGTLHDCCYPFTFGKFHCSWQAKCGHHKRKRWCQLIHGMEHAHH